MRAAAETTPPLRLSYFSVQDHYPDRARSVPDLYAQVLRQGELADRLGYEAFFVAEHHFHEYGTVPNPAVMLAALAQRTRTLKLGPAISVLTFHNPLNVAESYAMVDVLSNGRVVLGVGSGYLKHEFEGYAIAPAEKRTRFDENLTILKLALSGKRFSYEGTYTSVKDVQLNVVPVQPEVPVYVAILAREAAYHVGKQGNNIVCVPYASLDHFDEMPAFVAEFKRGRAESPVAPQPYDNIFAFHTHVAESDEACRRNAAEAFDLYVATRLYAKRRTYDDIMKSELGLFGSVENVADKIVALYRMGVTHIMTLQNFGYLPEEKVLQSMRLMAEEVMPRVARRIGRSAAA
jgi:alkanesulfonate monooxygenase SsuD/methylene tetrahydromethanopterin reductase-like flavin-dependent oxidoreductase (luciferase family)